MYYEINVSLNGQHFFATHARSLIDETKTRQVWFQMRKRFPISEGYQMELTFWKCSGEFVDTTNWLLRK